MFGWLKKKQEEPEPPVVLTENQRRLVAEVLDGAAQRYGTLHRVPLRFGVSIGVVTVTVFEQSDNLPNGWPRQCGYGVDIDEALEKLLGHINIKALFNHWDWKRKQPGTDATGDQS